MQAYILYDDKGKKVGECPGEMPELTNLISKAEKDGIMISRIVKETVVKPVNRSELFW